MDLYQYRPTRKLLQRHLLTLMDYSRTDIYEILSLALHLKKLAKKGKSISRMLRGKTIALILNRPSTRTRISFEQGVNQLGGTALSLGEDELWLGNGETVGDTAKTLARFDIDGIVLRTDAQADLVDFAKYGNFAVISGMTNDFYPCQALADLMTLYELYGKLEGLKLAYVGNGTNIANSLMIACSKVGVEIVCACPLEYQPSRDVLSYAKKFGKASVTENIEAAVTGAHAIYTDAFYPTGAAPDPKKKKALSPYCVTEEMFKLAERGAVFMHCMPATRNQEATANVVDAPYAVMFEQAENRLHIQKSVLKLLLR